MIYIEKKYLPVVELESPAAEAGFPVLEAALRLHLSDLVYFEAGQKLFGLVSLGDILRAGAAGEPSVRINTNFTGVKEDDWLRAREIFLERSGIHALPVTDEGGALQGAFSRFDDLLFLKYWDGWDHCRFLSRFVRAHRRIALVSPVGAAPECLRRFEQWKEILPSKGFDCREVPLDRVPEVCWQVDLILFADEDQRRGARALLTMEGRAFRGDRAMTFCDLTRALCEPPAEDVFRDLQERGIHVLLLNLDAAPSAYQEVLNRKFRMREERFGPGAGIVHPEEAPQFYGELYSEEYARKVGQHMFLMEKQNSFTRLKDCDEPYFHIADGERRTTGQPENAASSVFFFGPCLMVGPYVEDGHTIESFLQEILNKEGYRYRVVNCGCWESPYSELLRIESTPMEKGDVAVVFYQGRSFPDSDSLSLMQVAEENEVPGEWMLDAPIHCNDRVHRLYARAIFDRLKDRVLKRNSEESTGSRPRARMLFPSRKAVDRLYLDRYFWNLPPAAGSRVSNIGIHGNPFTEGHLRLAKAALERSDRLIVLVLEEEKGLFSFAERFAMACASLKELGDVVVVPSGPFHGTKLTFPEYFTRTEIDFEENLENEFRIFGTLIAPALGITLRVLGEEKPGTMMSRFNGIVSSVLADCGIETVVIPRKEVDGAPVSASAVRRLGASEQERLARLVPPGTLAILQCRALED